MSASAILPVLTADGVRLWARLHPGGPSPVVFCHGGPGGWDNLGQVADLLAPVATACRWDQRGCGRSDRVGPYSLSQSVDDLDTVRRHTGHAKVTVLGHSYGAHLALLYALAHPDHTAAVVYVSGTGIDPVDSWHPHYRRGRDAARSRHRTRWEELSGKSPRTPAEDREMTAIDWSADYADTAHALDLAAADVNAGHIPNAECGRAINAELKAQDPAALAAACSGLTVPVLIVDGGQDIRPRWSVDSLSASLPHVQRITLRRGGHLPWTEDPEGFTSAVTAFVRELRNS